MSRATRILLVLACWAGPLAAQAPPGAAAPAGPSGTSKTVRIGKWVVAGAWLGLTAAGVR